MENQSNRGKQFVKGYLEFIKSGRTYQGSVQVLEDGGLSFGARVLFQIIVSFSYVEGFCFATNETLGNRLGLHRTQVKRYLRELEATELVRVESNREKFGRREIYVDLNILNGRYQSSK